YGWPYYWGDAAAGTGFVAPVAPPMAPVAAGANSPAHEDSRTSEGNPTDASQRPRGDPHLRSAHAIRGHSIEAEDGPIGHVEDFMIDDVAWTFRYLLVDTRSWWPGKKVIVSRARIQEMRWQDLKVRVHLTRDAIKSAPEFDGADEISAE